MGAHLPGLSFVGRLAGQRLGGHLGPQLLGRHPPAVAVELLGLLGVERAQQQLVELCPGLVTRRLDLVDPQRVDDVQRPVKRKL
jgi:hypothetical protein